MTFALAVVMGALGLWLIRAAAVGHIRRRRLNSSAPAPSPGLPVDLLRKWAAQASMGRMIEEQLDARLKSRRMLWGGPPVPVDPYAVRFAVQREADQRGIRLWEHGKDGTDRLTAGELRVYELEAAIAICARELRRRLEAAEDPFPEG